MYRTSFVTHHRPGKLLLVAALVVLLYVLATHRLTRLVIRDAVPLVSRPRDWVLDTFGSYDSAGNLTRGRRWGVLGWSLAYVFTCDWCMSIWVGYGLLLACWLTGVDMPVPWLLPLVASSITGLLAEREK
jgi:hypothetical protein